MGRTIKFVLGAVAAIVLGLVLLVALALKPPAPGSIAYKRLHGLPVSLREEVTVVTEAKVEGPNLNLKIEADQAPDGREIVDAMAVVVAAVAKAMQSKVAEDGPAVENVTFQFMAKAKNRLGNTEMTNLAFVQFPADDLRNANIGNLNSVELMELAEDENLQSIQVRLAAEDWCRTKSSNGVNFCRRLLAED